MEKSKRLLTLIAIAAVLTISTVALAINGNWFSLILDPMGLDIPDISTEETLELLEMPQWVSSEVSMEGSGYSGQVHNVSVTLYHDRTSNGFPWIADGSYSLNLKLAGTIVEPILSGSFTNLGMWNPYTTSYLWTPLSPPDNYTIELNITNISWSEMPTYTITATAGLGGSISDPGETIVLEGGFLVFTITPDSGYSILDVLVDGISVGPVSEYPFENVTADRTIHASFTMTSPVITGMTLTPHEKFTLNDTDWYIEGEWIWGVFKMQLNETVLSMTGTVIQIEVYNGMTLIETISPLNIGYDPPILAGGIFEIRWNCISTTYTLGEYQLVLTILSYNGS